MQFRFMTRFCISATLSRNNGPLCADTPISGTRADTREDSDHAVW